MEINLFENDMSLDEFMEAYEATLHFDDAESDTVLRERYLRIKAHEANQDSSTVLKKLRAKSIFDDLDKA